MKFHLLSTATALISAQILHLSSAENIFLDEDRPRLRPQTRIINGFESNEHEHSFAVSLVRSSHFCGGSLIAKNVVLTAAHCNGGPYSVVLGRHNLKTDNGGDVLEMEKEIVHPGYIQETKDNDFMIVILEKPADLSDEVSLVSLNKSESTPEVGDQLTVMGWGTTEDGDLSDTLMEVDVNMISSAVCDDSSYMDKSYNGRISENMLCARADGQDSCQGDSGGPLINDAGVQVGVVSWGIGCATPYFAGVYAKVSRTYSWIEETVCRESPAYGAEAGFDCTDASSFAVQALSLMPPSPNPPSPSTPGSGMGSYNPPPTSDGGDEFTYDYEDGFTYDSFPKQAEVQTPSPTPPPTRRPRRTPNPTRRGSRFNPTPTADGTPSTIADFFGRGN